jgi:hypothetical protein
MIRKGVSLIFKLVGPKKDFCAFRDKVRVILIGKRGKKKKDPGQNFNIDGLRYASPLFSLSFRETLTMTQRQGCTVSLGDALAD